jgi:hypothetical protein
VSAAAAGEEAGQPGSLADCACLFDKVGWGRAAPCNPALLLCRRRVTCCLQLCVCWRCHRV